MKKAEKIATIIRLEVNLLFSGLTIRQIAERLNMSKSTVHYHLSKCVMIAIGPLTAKAVWERLDYNFSQKYIRGGQANRKRWQEIRSKEAK